MNKTKKIEKETEEKFALPPKNVYLLIIGLVVIALGFVLMAGGGSRDPEIFSGETLFSFRRMVIAPVLVCGGFVFEIVAIMRIKKAKGNERV
ncbi:MAG: DUF3098 domain-containing protein [Bacteroidales bacterium]|jgi:hypothetical protein|nr:DUF3098 domain-containing protein [Bacteroidales bacterium]MDD2823925.1 DUF3098 domain-containing protein [Bacteroidales bacterium]MDD3099944.1 DUF3098 domain-containing protein [Bacteroidales bacterium]MDD3638776.1 DUF3098 domain-containing protein [Bacteroidales bacterium]MDD3943445.1 DUF3098 domain-containing protein [Bacteroidales bacterium]